MRDEASEEDPNSMGLSVLDNMEISMVHVLPTDFQSSTAQPNFLDGDVVAEEASHVDFVSVVEVDSATKDDNIKSALAELFPRSSSANLHHLKPLYVTAHIEGYPVSKVFVDYGATVNIMPMNIMKALRRSNDELIPSGIIMSSFIGDKSQTKGVLPLTKAIELMFDTDREKRRAAVSSTMERLLAHWYTISKQPNLGVNLVEFLAEGNNGPVLSLDKVKAAPAKLEDHQPQVKDPLEEINVGTADDPHPLFISALLPQQMKDELRALLTEFKDCFAWSYHEVPGLDRTLVEHELRIKPGCKPFCQPPRRFSIEKNGALRICIDFRNLNLATPKDEYTMPISDLLIDATANHAILSFMDGHIGYNQIFIAEADVHKTAFCCPGALGTYEWVVMPFGLKNAGATYQWAMNTIFHDLIGTIVEVYIDDVVIKSKQRRTHLDDLRQAFLRMRQHNLKMNPAKCAFDVSAGNFLGFLAHHRGIEVDENKARAIIVLHPQRRRNNYSPYSAR
ncbi:hypothetical protein ACFX2F_040495 [Malus domestica]